MTWDTTDTTEATATDAIGRNLSPRVAATRRLAKAEKDLKRSKAFWDSSRTRSVPPTVEVAQAAYDAAAEELKNLL